MVRGEKNVAVSRRRFSFLQHFLVVNFTLRKWTRFFLSKRKCSFCPKERFFVQKEKLFLSKGKFPTNQTPSAADKNRINTALEPKELRGAVY